MKGLAICHKGLEDVSKAEVRELICTDSKIEETVVLFDIKKLQELYVLGYKGQSFIKVLYFIDSFRFNNDFFEKLKNAVKKANIKQFIEENTTFRVDCWRVGSHDFSSLDVEKTVADSFNLKVDFDNPELIFYVYVCNNKCYFCVDTADFELSKRDYKIFTGASSLKGTIAYSLIKLAGFKKNHVFIDPCCGSGTIPIEAALYATGFSANYFRKEKFSFLEKFDFDRFDKKIDLKKKTHIFGFAHLLAKVKSSQKNAKIAGINKKINFSKLDIEWLDTKFDEKSVDTVVTYLPSLSKRINEKLVEKLYKEFFYQLEFVLKKKGIIVVAVRNSEFLKKVLKKYKFKLKEEREVWQGKEVLKVLVISKKCIVK